MPFQTDVVCSSLKRLQKMFCEESLNFCVVVLSLAGNDIYALLFWTHSILFKTKPP